MKIVKTIQPTIAILTAAKNCCILHGPVFVMFFSKTTLAIKAKFYVEPPWVGGGGDISFAASGSHDQDGRHAQIL